jgi:predicted ABC-type transport system involved in lysophospholipase L1 biosynthesis ATPase subunit
VLDHRNLIAPGEGALAGPPAETVPTLRLHDVYKRFGRVEVLRGIDLDVWPGEIVSLVGENGTGKSTVVQCVAGSVQPDRGTVSVAGNPLVAQLSDAREHGIAVVWQDLALCDNLSVVANLFLGDEIRDRATLDDRAMVAEASALFDALHLVSTDLQRPVGTLSGGQRQLVAIARAVRRRCWCSTSPPLRSVSTRRWSSNASSTICARPALRSCWCRTGSTRCSGSPTGSPSCAKDASARSRRHSKCIPTTSSR